MAKNNPYALQFVNNQYVWCGSPTCYDLGNNAPFTVEAWVNPTALKNYGGIFNKNTAGRTSPYSFMTVLHGDGTLGAYNGSAWLFSGVTGIVAGNWYHLAYVFNGTTMAFYVNAVNKGNVAFTWTDNNAHEVTIGSWYTGGTYDLNAKFDEVRFWNKARSQSELQRDMNRSLIGDESGLIGYWKFDEGANYGIAIDNSINKNNGYLMNLPTSVVANVDLNYVLGNGFLQTEIWYSKNNANFNMTLDSTYGNQIKYRAVLNGVEIIPFNSLTNIPYNINFDISMSLFNIGENLLYIDCINDTNTSYKFGYYKIVVENKDTLSMIRKTINEEEWNSVYGKVNFQYGGTIVGGGEDILYTNTYSTLNTNGKRTITKITIDCDNDFNGQAPNIINFSSQISTTDSNFKTECPLDLSKFNNITDIIIL